MPQFTYKALDGNKQLKTGNIEAPTRGDAILLLRDQQLQPLDVTLQTAVPTANQRPAGERGAPLTIGQQLLFFTTLQQTESAGIPVISAMDLLASQSRGNLRSIAQQMQQAILKGESLSQQMTRFEGRFTPPCPALIRAGEISGKVGEMAAECSQWLATITVARRQAVSELIYPVIMLAFALFVPAIPAIVLANLGESMAVDPSIFAGAKLAFHNSMIRGLILAIFVAVILAIRYISNFKPAVKNALDSFAWHMPIYNSMERSGAQFRFLRALGSLYHAGLPPAQCLEYACQSAGQMVIAKRISEQISAVRNGGTLAAALLASNTMPLAVTSQMLVAETSGKIDESLVRLSAMLEDIHRNAVRRLLVITGLLGLVYAMVVGGISAIDMMKGVVGGYQNQINTIEP